MRYQQRGTKVSVDHVIIHPTEEQLRRYVAEAIEKVNDNCKTRCVKMPLVKEVFQSKKGRMEANGGTPSTLPGATSRIGIAWWTDAIERKHVRIVADRTVLENRYVPSIFGFGAAGQSDFWCVYHDKGKLEYKKMVLYCVCGNKGNPEDLEWDGNHCRECREIEKYEQDTGFIPAVGKTHGRRKKGHKGS